MRFTRHDLANFILSQTDDEPVSMGEPIVGGTNPAGGLCCGCLLVQFGRSKGLVEGMCSYNTIDNYTRDYRFLDFGKDENKVANFILNALNGNVDSVKDSVKNFGDAKKLLHLLA